MSNVPDAVTGTAALAGTETGTNIGTEVAAGRVAAAAFDTQTSSLIRERRFSNVNTVVLTAAVFVELAAEALVFMEDEPEEEPTAARTELLTTEGMGG